MGDYYVMIGVSIVILLIIIYMYIKDLENSRKLKSYEKSIEELNKQIYSLQKSVNEFEQSHKKSSIKSERGIDEKLNEFRAEIQNDINSTITKITPLVDIIQEVQRSFQNHKNKIDTRMAQIEDRVKSVISLPTSLNSSTEESKIISLYQSGKSKEEIAKELRLTSGEVEFFLKISNFGNSEKSTK